MYSIASEITTVKVKAKSLFRIYITQNVIDIDVYLHRADSQQVKAGSGQFGDESFVTVLEAGDYYLRFEFYNWGSTDPKCARFSMQIAIAPMTDIPPLQPSCPSTVDEVSFCIS